MARRREPGRDASGLFGDRGHTGGAMWAALVGLGLSVWAPPVQAQEPPDTIRPDTIQVDSTLLRIQERLKGLAKPPGIDSVYFLPDSLLPDSIRELREASDPRRRGASSSRTRGGEGLSGGDSIMSALAALEGFTLTQYESSGADFGAKERRLVLRGAGDLRARIISDGQEVTADTALVYSEETGKIWSMGSAASFSSPGQEPVESRVIVFDLNEERGTALGATTRYSGGADWIVHGDLTSVTEAASYGSSLSFTSCELEEPHYHFAAKEVKIARNDIMVARPVTLYFADVPVFWLPFIAQSMDRDRASGILTPVFSVNDIVRTSRGYSRRLSNLGFYWAMSDYYDTTVFLDWWSGEHLALTGSLRYNWTKQFLNGSLNFRRFWRENGGKELAFNGNTSWEMSERTNLRFRASYASSTSLIRETSFDPAQVVQSIDSEGGLSRRFDFGNLTLSANRRQYLSDDRVEMTLPNLSFSLSPQTFLKASPGQGRFYNNLTWSGSASMRRSVSDRPDQLDSGDFSRSMADQVRTNASLSSGLSLGNFSLSTGAQLEENLVKGVPVDTDPEWKLGPEPAVRIEDQAEAELTVNASLNYQQRLIGSTTFTPGLSLSTGFRRADTIPEATDFVSGPTRLSFTASLRTDLYGFFPGVGPFEAIRHKMSPGFDFSYAPKVSPTDLQRDVFGSAEVGAVRTLRISLNQTFEAKRKEDPNAVPGAPGAAPAPPGSGPGLPSDSLQGAPAIPDSLLADSTRADSLQGPQSTDPTRKVTLLTLRTTAIAYDFERADEAGDWLWGIQTTTLTNQISSDFLRGLNLRVAHDLFEDETPAGGGSGPTQGKRKFSPHLSQVNFGFSLDSNSLPIRLLGSLLGREGDTATSVVAAQPAGSASQGDPFAPSLSDESSVIPIGDPSVSRTRSRGQAGGSGQAGSWRANLTYSLQRPRNEALPANQMLQGNVTFNPTEKWQASWRTSYDMEKGSFNDHMIRFTRDLHRWEAHFDFSQTATGNWSFRFEVVLTDNEDLHFDYQQRSIQDPSGVRRF